VLHVRHLGYQESVRDVIEETISSEENDVQHCKDEIKLQKSANAIALMARKLSKDPKFLSPFAVNALAAGIETEGGKPDDITVLLATVSL
jgi:protein phosphatase PTC7